MGNLKIAKKGQVVIFTKGYYSPYRVIGVYEVSEDFRPYDELQEYLEKSPRQSEEYYSEGYGFLSYLDQKGYLKDISNVVIHLGDYGGASEVCFTQGF